jgi:Zn-dependent protease with chaperone function
MADIGIWGNEMRSGTLPQICVLTGEPTEDSMTFKFATAPGWTLLLLLVGLLPYVIGYAITAKRAQGRLPLAGRKRGGVIAVRWGGWAAILVGIVCVFGSVATSSNEEASSTASGVLILLSLLFIFAGIIAVIVRGFVGIRGKVQGAPGYADHWVTLSRVHPLFADAVIRMYHERASQAGAQAGYPAAVQPPSTAPLPAPSTPVVSAPNPDPYAQRTPGT